ncbi:MAG: hypothetical protein HZB80_05860 [Deltaproteobacteria bacterium]|nr:hypothetical protein [Deltaproteobacteria bacterium]
MVSLKESLKDVEDVDSKLDEERERGKGIHYVLMKRLRLNPKNVIAFFDKRNLWPNTASKLAV